MTKQKTTNAANLDIKYGKEFACHVLLNQLHEKKKLLNNIMR